LRRPIEIAFKSSCLLYCIASVSYRVLLRFGGHLKIDTMICWEVSDDKEETI
jgi:hypothetical protein